MSYITTSEWTSFGMCITLRYIYVNIDLWFEDTSSINELGNGCV